MKNRVSITHGVFFFLFIFFSLFFIFFNIYYFFNFLVWHLAQVFSLLGVARQFCPPRTSGALAERQTNHGRLEKLT
jgi:hypothetical protein